MLTSLQKWGNSFAVRIPASFVKTLHMHSGTPLEIVIDGDRISILPKTLSLNELLDRITPQNCHDLLLDDALPQGKEEW